jgi:para-aminobenzoate synthetase component 1
MAAMVPALPRPVVLLEDGIGSHGYARLAWGARSRRRLPWLPAHVGDLSPLARLPLVRLYGILAYDLGLPPGAVRHAPVVSIPVLDLFEPEYEIVVDLASDSLVSGAFPSSSSVSSVPSVVQSVLRDRSFDEHTFGAAVTRIKEHIAAGDVYQVNLAVAEQFRTNAGAWTLYQRLRALNPSPWMGFADFGDWQLVCGSPELLIEVQSAPGGWHARTRPIAGTRKKTGDATQDAAMRAELALDAKEQAEHRMLLDLARNDLGQVARWGTVRVSEREVIEEYSHVFHLVSEVVADLPATVTPGQAVAAMFPGGTITGAPKRRAMEVIASLEPVARGAYTGGLGWLGPDGAQMNIVIRSLTVRDDVAVVQAGAGIVWDSDPTREWRESLRKGAALREVLGA